MTGKEYNTKNSNIDKDFMIDYLAALAITYAEELGKLADMEKEIDITYLGASGACFAMQEAFTSEEIDYIYDRPLFTGMLSGGDDAGNKNIYYWRFNEEKNK